MTAGLAGEDHGREVQWEHLGHRVGAAEDGPEEHVEHPGEGDEQSAVHFGAHDRADEHAESEVDDRDQQGGGDRSGWVRDACARR